MRRAITVFKERQGARDVTMRKQKEVGGNLDGALPQALFQSHSSSRPLVHRRAPQSQAEAAPAPCCCCASYIRISKMGGRSFRSRLTTLEAWSSR